MTEKDQNGSEVVARKGAFTSIRDKEGFYHFLMDPKRPLDGQDLDDLAEVYFYTRLREMKAEKEREK